MTEYTDNLIAEARTYEDAVTGGEGENWMRLVNLVSSLADALGAVQPVTPDRERMIEEGARYNGPKRVVVKAVDQIIASGVLGQPRTDAPLDPEPKRGYHASVCAARYGDPSECDCGG